MAEPLIRNISDTARWVAVYRANETERADALFRDPYARRLAGERGAEIERSMRSGEDTSWSWTARTCLFDEMVFNEVEKGADLVLNLAAGLDARPYRMKLPSSLRWIEVDLPEILAYKEEILRDAKPACAVERIALDLSIPEARRDLFTKLAGSARRIVVLSEGLLIYLSPEQVGELARDLAERPSFQRWIVDICSPGLREMLAKKIEGLRDIGHSLQFAPPEGPQFFTPYGWRPMEVRSLLKTAGRQKRLPLFLRVLSLLPESKGAQGKRPWAAACLMAR